jgi:hypothetical protein
MTARTYELYISRDADSHTTDHDIFCLLSEFLAQPILATGSGTGCGTRDLDFRLEADLTEVQVVDLQCRIRNRCEDETIDVIYEEWPEGSGHDEPIIAYYGDGALIA